MNRRRKRTSGGQALVMVTLALVSMCGMMGLAVDLGWSFFVQKSAQAAADGAALAAVQEAYRLNGGGGATCSTGCTPSPMVSCSTISSTNLFSGCQYAARNGFTPGGEGGRQNVTIQADTTIPAPTVPNVTDIRYWVTVRTAQAIPQLFSSVLGNTQGTVSAIATAAIAGSILPGSFYGMNREGDCITGLGNNGGLLRDCGVDINLSGTQNNVTQCIGMDGSTTGVPAKLCAPAGIFLSSQCHGQGVAGCGDSANATNGFAGQTDNQPKVWSQGGTQINGSGWVGRGSGNLTADTQNWLPANSVRNQSTSDFSDPLKTKLQPPIVNPSQPTCAIVGATVTGTLGPFQYYAVDGTGNATGLPLRIGNGATVAFDPASTNCPGTVGGGAVSTGSFKTFTFWGGLNIDGNNGTNVTFGAGQYVMAGTSSQTGAVLSMSGANIAGANGGTAPTMFLTTNGNYSSQGTSLTKPAALSTVNLYQGSTYIKNADIRLNGITASAGALAADYKGILLWQDRRNSNLEINPDNGAFVSRTRPATVTDTSPQVILDSGGAELRMDGLLYQPRGAWTYWASGGQSGNASFQLTMVTGALTCGATGCGNASMILRGPSAPTVIYITSLIQ